MKKYTLFMPAKYEGDQFVKAEVIGSFTRAQYEALRVLNKAYEGFESAQYREEDGMWVHSWPSSTSITRRRERDEFRFVFDPAGLPTLRVLKRNGLVESKEVFWSDVATPSVSWAMTEFGRAAFLFLQAQDLRDRAYAEVQRLKRSIKESEAIMKEQGAVLRALHNKEDAA